MAKELSNLKTWNFVKSQRFNIQTIGENSPEEYLFQLSNGYYYPAIKISDVPSEFVIASEDLTKL